MGKDAEALAEFDTAISLNPKEPAFYINKSVSSFRLGKIEDARKNARQALRLGAKLPPDYLQQIGLK